MEKMQMAWALAVVITLTVIALILRESVDYDRRFEGQFVGEYDGRTISWKVRIQESRLAGQEKRTVVLEARDPKVRPVQIAGWGNFEGWHQVTVTRFSNGGWVEHRRNEKGRWVRALCEWCEDYPPTGRELEAGMKALAMALAAVRDSAHQTYYHEYRPERITDPDDKWYN